MNVRIGAVDYRGLLRNRAFFSYGEMSPGLADQYKATSGFAIEVRFRPTQQTIPNWYDYCTTVRFYLRITFRRGSEKRRSHLKTPIKMSIRGAAGMKVKTTCAGRRPVKGIGFKGRLCRLASARSVGFLGENTSTGLAEVRAGRLDIPEHRDTARISLFRARRLCAARERQAPCISHRSARRS